MSNSHGNVLFLILIAVALFAALSYAITSSNRTGSGNAASETAEMGAARIMGFMAKLDAAAMRIMMNKGVDVHQIIYSTPAYTFTDGSAKVSSPTQSSNPEIALFNASNGVVPETFVDLRDKNFVIVAGPGTTMPGHLGFSWMSFPNLGTTNAEPIVSILALSQEVCQKINQKSGIPSIPVMTGSMTSPAVVGSSGTPGSVPLPLSASDLALLSGKYEFCIRYQAPDSRYIYLHAYKVF